MAKKDEPPPPSHASASSDLDSAPPSRRSPTSGSPVEDGSVPAPPESRPSAKTARSRRPKRRGKNPGGAEALVEVGDFGPLQTDDKTPPPLVFDVPAAAQAADADQGSAADVEGEIDAIFAAFVAGEGAAVAREFESALAAGDDIVFVDARLVALASTPVRARRARFRRYAAGLTALAAAFCVVAGLRAPPGTLDTLATTGLRGMTGWSVDASATSTVAAVTSPLLPEPEVDDDSARASEAERLVSKHALAAARLDEAINAAKRATSLDPRSADAWVALALAYEPAGEPKEAQGAREACEARSSAAHRGDGATCVAAAAR